MKIQFDLGGFNMNIFEAIKQHLYARSGDVLIELTESKDKNKCDYYATCEDSSYKIFIEDDSITSIWI